jgi:hypothetical protein
MASPDDSIKGPWETPIVRREDGTPIGVILALTEQDLADLGLEIESKEKLLYYISDEKILLVSEKVDDCCSN